MAAEAALREEFGDEAAGAMVRNAQGSLEGIQVRRRLFAVARRVAQTT